MKTVKDVLKWLSGKKSVLAGIITTTSAYWVQMGHMTPETGSYIAAISLILFGSASLLTGRVVYGK